jgi:uncharacterized protein (DUF305 family)
MRKLWISLVVLVMAALVLSACGAAPAASSAPAAPAAQAAPSESKAAATVQPTAAPAASGEMQHNADPMSDNSYDVHFIDSTLEHHAGVIGMAQQALKDSQNVALKDLAQKTMTATQKEIDWLKAYRQTQHPKAAMMKDTMAMGSMGMSMDTSKPFDKRYAEAMISHHQGSITMAKEAQTKLGHADLKQFAKDMQAGEEAEVAQLQQFAK